MAEMSDKKTPPGGERFRGGANKGTGILRVETFVPRQLVKIYSKHRAKATAYAACTVNPCFSGGLGGLLRVGCDARSVPLMAHYLAAYGENAAKLGYIAAPFMAQ